MTGTQLWASFLAVDPGGVHCGVARFKRGVCVWAKEWTPSGLMDWVERNRANINGIVMEEFRLYPWKAQQQSFSTLEVVQTIGALKYICRKASMPCLEQSAMIKKPTELQARAKGIKLKSHGHGGHAKDAELHGLHYLFKQQRLDAERV